MTAITTALQNVSLSLPTGRMHVAASRIRAAIRCTGFAFNKLNRQLEAAVWSARVEAVYHVEQVAAEAGKRSADFAVASAWLLPFLTVWLLAVGLSHLNIGTYSHLLPFAAFTALILLSVVLVRTGSPQ